MIEAILTAFVFVYLVVVENKISLSFAQALCDVEEIVKRNKQLLPHHIERIGLHNLTAKRGVLCWRGRHTQDAWFIYEGKNAESIRKDLGSKKCTTLK